MEKTMKVEKNYINVEFTAETVLEIMPEWKGESIEVSPLKGGLTNKIWRAKCAKGDVAIRVFGDQTEMFIDREREAAALKAMAEKDITSNFVKYIPQNRVTVVDFIIGSKTLSNDDFKNPELWPLVVEPVRRTHKSGVKLEGTFNPMERIHKMKALLDGFGKEYPELDLDGTIKKLEKIDNIIGIKEDDYVITHNDLLAENFMLIEDEYKDKYDNPVYLIDWENSAMGPRFYDLAVTFQETLVDRNVQKEIVMAYCEGKDFEKTLFNIDMFKPFSETYWAIWSLIQMNVSTIEFDYYPYGKEKYDRAVELIAWLEGEYNLDL